MDEKSLEMHGESRQPVSISVPLRKTTKQYFHPIELMLDSDQGTCQLCLCPSSLTWDMNGEDMGFRSFKPG